MRGFQDLKLDAGLLEHLTGLGYRRPTALQEEAVPVIARGTTATGVASAGSGKTLAYALGLAARLAPKASALQALVLRPTDERAAATAEALHRLFQPVGAGVAVVQPRSAAPAQVAVASPSAALAALERSAIKLDGLATLVVDGASAMMELGAADALETLAAHVPKEAQRVLFSSELTRDVEDWLDRHARRARRLTGLPAEVEPLRDVTVAFCAAPRERWMPALVRALAGAAAKGGDRSRIHCRFEREAKELADRLSVRGLHIAANADEAGVRLQWGGEVDDGPAALSVSWGAPSDLPRFREQLEAAERAIVFAEPAELAHLQRLAGALDVRLTPLKTAAPTDALRSTQLTRDQLRDAAINRDLEPYILLLEPLLEEFTPTQLAAAAAALYRERAPGAPAETLPAWTRLYFGVGRRDSVRPADLVGAITGETSVSGNQIGRIEVRDTYSLVEVSAAVADQVIKGLAATTIRGRPANVRVFRE